jgi:hypothetical protein
MHIFWQKRIRVGDVTTPFWFPSVTKGGMIGGDRLVFPIPPGTHWSDAKPVVLPGEVNEANVKQLPEANVKRRKKPPVVVQEKKVQPIQTGRLKFFGTLPTPIVEPVKPEKKVKQKKVHAKHDPKQLAFARELRDRYLEEYNTSPALAGGKYEVGRLVDQDVEIEMSPKLLAARDSRKPSSLSGMGDGLPEVRHGGLKTGAEKLLR